MALVEVNTPSGAFDFARGLIVQPHPRNAVPHDALAQLSRLRDEAGRDLRIARFLASAPKACMVLLAAGSLTALSSANGLGYEFTWAMMLLAGIVAIIASHIRNFAVAGLSLQGAATHLRGLLLYSGLAWGSGAFLVLPAQPLPALTFVFAVVPAALLGLIVQDRKGVAAFAAPAAVATVTAATLGHWPQMLWIGAAIAAALPGIIAIPALQQKPRPGSPSVP
jgi:hypothetical protein